MKNQKKSTIRITVWMLIALILPLISRGQELRLALPFSDHAVLQCELPLSFWGTGVPSSVVEVSLDGEAWGTATVTSNGTWETELPSQLPSNKPHTIVVRCGEDRVELNDILLGSVKRAEMIDNYQKLKNRLGKGGASAKAADSIISFLNS